jgi:hypothetical protein
MQLQLREQYWRLGKQQYPGDSVPDSAHVLQFMFGAFCLR